MEESTQEILKKKLSFDEMIEHLDQKNVKFELITKDEAKNLLQTSNYFYKITAYRKNFEKNKYDKYVNLDFKLLQDLATIDMRLRYLVLHMSLDIEHAIKTQILMDIISRTGCTNNSENSLQFMKIHGVCGLKYGKFFVRAILHRASFLLKKISNKDSGKKFRIFGKYV